jgi:hypothetical protein
MDNLLMPERPGQICKIISDIPDNEQEEVYIVIENPVEFDADDEILVRIEAMEEAGDTNTESEYLTMTIRPVANPRHPDKAIAHFFSHASTNTFIIERYQNHVSAAVYGRNEMPNNKDTGLYDTVRNTIIALGARNGLSGPQWKSLVEGLLDK